MKVEGTCLNPFTPELMPGVTRQSALVAQFEASVVPRPSARAIERMNLFLLPRLPRTMILIPDTATFAKRKACNPLPSVFSTQQNLKQCGWENRKSVLLSALDMNAWVQPSRMPPLSEYAMQEG